MILPELQYEQSAWGKGHQVVVGIDEVGRGAWAGPVVAAAVQLPRRSICFNQQPVNSNAIILPKLLRDSKKLSASQRLQLNDEIRSIAEQVTIGLVDVETISQIGLGPANFLAMSRSLEQLRPQPDFTLIDGFNHPAIAPQRQQAIIKGDSLVASIAAASVVAKVYRDQLMVEQSAIYPNYGFEQHKGYGTAAHQHAIAKHGLSPLHRQNFQLKFLSPGIEP